MNAIDQVAR